MTSGQRFSFALKGISNGIEIANIFDSARKILELRREMQAAGGDVPNGIKGQYDALAAFVKAMDVEVAKARVRYGIPEPITDDRSSEPAQKGAESQKVADPIIGTKCDLPGCPACDGGRKVAEPTGKNLLDFIESLLTARVKDLSGPRPPKTNDVQAEGI